MTKLLPSPAITVITDAAGLPVRLQWQGWRTSVASICNHWRVEEDWWRNAIGRDYYKLCTSDGTLCVVFRDHASGSWHLQRVYD